MSTSATAEELISACFDELQANRRVEPYVQKAEEAGFPQLAKMFRAVVAGESVREALYRKGLVTHASQEGDYYVCPHCGLIYFYECPELCPVDETPGEAFLKIS